MASTARKEATVVGGGPCGSLLAMYLLEAGYAVDVYELRPADERSAEKDHSGGVLGQAASATRRSINFALSHRGICALRELGLDETILAKAVPMHSRYLHLADGSVAEQRYGNSAEEVIYSVSRPDVVELLERAAVKRGATYHHVHKLVAFDAELRPEFECNKGSGEGVKRVGACGRGPTFGCDGAFSATRRCVERRGRFDTKVWYARQGYKELHVPARKDGSYAFPPNYLHIWPRGSNMLIALPNQDGSFTSTVFADVGLLETMDRSWSRAEIGAWFKTTFPDAFSAMPTVLEDWAANPTAPLVQLQVAPWHRDDRVLLLGDASHAVVPFYGQGMNAAFEDCLVFAEILAAHPDDQGDHSLRAAFVEMSGRRRRAADALSTLATMNYEDMASNTASRLYRLKSALENAIHRALPALWTPLYTMVTFTRLPYDMVLDKHHRQQRILDALAKATLAAAAATLTLGAAALARVLSRARL